ncbi:hypothetical protein [Haloarcula sp. 1CSR25-25]|uniref:hypothetical protein n=1 Tax=Haloarcula sp. 1CSR25-25 TaxID=2862545 RepID=UPI002894B47E|nr:hypothetical protein [Haloarcula sp. 1CSR25-25]MDT3434682.1 hypothetical protein [Haloarcula sp. 1CSR25-25]
MPDPSLTFTYGASRPATYGSTRPGTYGAVPTAQYRLRLRAPNGQQILTTALLSIDVTLEHTAVSTLTAELPPFDRLEDFILGDATLEFRGERLFQGRILGLPGPTTGDTATIEVSGPARTLTRGAIAVGPFSGDAYEAIAAVWREYTRFDATVLVPDSPTSLSDYSTEGTPMEVLQDLHELAGMRFTVSHQQTGPRVESYVPEETVKTDDWTATEWDSSLDATNYANAVEVYGGESSDGSRAFARAADQSEIDRLSDEILVRIDDETLTTDADCQARADSELANRLTEDDLSGSVEIIPQVVLPGYHYTISEFDTGDGAPALPVEQTHLRESQGEARATLEVNDSGRGVVDTIVDLRRETAQLNQP